MSLRSAEANRVTWLARYKAARAAKACVFCGRPSLVGKTRCEQHAKHRPHICGECDQPGHNALRCPTKGKR